MSKSLSLLGILVVVVIGYIIWDTQINSIREIGSIAETNANVSSPKQLLDNIKNNLGSSKASVDLSNQSLDAVPSYIFDQTTIQELNLSNNNLSGAIPAEIRFLSNLEVLNLSNNNMTGLPAEIGQLSRLRVLNVSNNSLTGLPYELGNLKNLEIFNISGNNYSQQDLEIIKQGLPSDVNIVY